MAFGLLGPIKSEKNMFNIFKKKSKSTSLNLVVRMAREKDAVAIGKLIHDEYGHHEETYIRRTISDMRNSKGRMVCVSTVEGIIVGYARCRLFEEAKYPYNGEFGWYLMGMVVHPNFRKRGIGKKLIEFRINWLRSKTKEIFYITNSRNTPSIQSHDSFGFKEIARARGFLNADFSDDQAVLFQKRLTS